MVISVFHETLIQISNLLLTEYLTQGAQRKAV